MLSIYTPSPPHSFPIKRAIWSHSSVTLAPHGVAIHAKLLLWYKRTLSLASSAPCLEDKNKDCCFSRRSATSFFSVVVLSAWILRQLWLRNRERVGGLILASLPHVEVSLGKMFKPTAAWICWLVCVCERLDGACGVKMPFMNVGLEFDKHFTQSFAAVTSLSNYCALEHLELATIPLP